MSDEPVCVRKSYIHAMNLLVLGLNPAWQRLFVVPKLVLGSVHRLPPAVEHASGKGINMVRVLQRLGTSGHLLQFSGGALGKKLCAELSCIQTNVQNISTLGETRICTTISTEEGESTELIEPSQTLQDSEVAEFFVALAANWPVATHIALCGTAPKRFPWGRLCEQDLQGKRTYLDAWQGVEPWLARGVSLLKINVEELGLLLGVAPQSEVVDVFALGKTALLRWPIETLVITQGSRRVLVFTREKIYTLCPSKPHRFVNAIGAGDSFLAGWISADLAQQSLPHCLAKAVAVSSARIECALPWELDLARVRQIELEALSRIGEQAWDS